jgi:hypothetical protein
MSLAARRSVGLALLCFVAVSFTNKPTRGEDATPTKPAKPASNLSSEIDRLIKERAGPVIAPRASETTLLRRLYLDFAGRVPTLAESRRYLADQKPDKQARLLDELLAGPEYARRMRELFHVMLMERRGDHDEWQKYLQASFAANKPWDQLVREILAPQTEDEALRGAAFFHTRRLEKVGQQEVDYPGLTRDIGRLFMGVDLQCAQCHDHLTIDEYKQVDFQGLYSVVSHSFIRTDKKFPAIGEKAIPAKTEFTSVFEGVKRETGPRVPFGTEMPLLPVPAKGKTPESSLALIATSLPNAENARFTNNIANRLWFVLMGRGLVHPLDLQHGGNPASHPELLALLSRELAAHQFDLKWYLRELALTETYARASFLSEKMDATQELPDPKLFAVGLERRLSAEQWLWSFLAATLDPAEWNDAAQRETQFKKHAPRVLAAFANPAKEPEDSYQASLQGALFTLHDTNLFPMLESRGQNLLARAVANADTNAAIDELYLALLVRTPSDEERRDGVAFVEKAGKEQRTKALRDLAWAMIASLEFSLNH